MGRGPEDIPGAGKSTTLKMATDMISPTEGRVVLNGEPVRGNRERAFSCCEVLIESPVIYPSLGYFVITTALGSYSSNVRNLHSELM